MELPNFNLKFKKDSFTYSLTNLWNSLPSQVRLSSDANDFRSKLHDCSFLERLSYIKLIKSEEPLIKSEEPPIKSEEPLAGDLINLLTYLVHDCSLLLFLERVYYSFPVTFLVYGFLVGFTFLYFVFITKFFFLLS